MPLQIIRLFPTRSQKLYFVLFLCLFTVYYDTRLCPLGCFSYELWRDHRFMGATIIPSPSARKPGENCPAEAVVGCNRLCLCFKALPQSQARKVDLLLPSWYSSCAGQRLTNVQINNLKKINGCVPANQNEARRLLLLTGKVCRKNLDCHIRGYSDG
jgi:hypothetical protein